MATSLSPEASLSYVSAAMTRIQHISLDTQALRVIQRETLVSVVDGNETGGILLGSRSETAPAHVRFAGTPGPDAIRRPDFFLRDLAHTQAFADRHFLDNGSVWVGEWHTHPKSPPVPSRQDIATYTRLLADPELDFGGEFISLILGPVESSPQRWSLVGWACSAVRVSCVPIHQHP